MNLFPELAIRISSFLAYSNGNASEKTNAKWGNMGS
jgi:hypothetical protein